VHKNLSTSVSTMTESELAMVVLDNLGRRLTAVERYDRDVAFTDMIVWSIYCGNGCTGYVSYDSTLRENKGGFVLGIVTPYNVLFIHGLRVKKALSGFECMEAIAAKNSIIARQLAKPIMG